jgi:hypothetical protein
MIPFLAAFLAASLCATAASVSVRETASSSRFKLDPKYRSASWAAAAYDQHRTVEISTHVSPAELAAGVVVEVAYMDPTQPERGVYAPAHSITQTTLSHRGPVEFVWEAAPSRKDAWAARVIVGGKVTAWAAENDKALAWIKEQPAP